MKKLILFILFTVTLQFAFAQRKYYEGKWQSNSQYKITDTSAFIDTLRPKSLFPVSQGGDIAFIYGVLKVIIANGCSGSKMGQNRC